MGEKYNIDNRTHHPLYTTWRGMISRWLDMRDGFKNFISDMGEKPEGTTLDRIDVNGDCSPENCRWANLYEQQANRRCKNHTTGVVGIMRNKGSNRFYAEIGGKKNRIRKSFMTLKEAEEWRASYLESLRKEK